LIRRFGWAGHGVIAHFRTQENARIHFGAAVVTVVAGFLFGISRGEWIAVILAIGLVMTAEAFNTAIESVVDLVSPEQHPLAGRAKDVAAGAVLMAAMTAVVVGVLVFGPHLLALASH
jgi:diacylglycerol kinase (ATP)